MWLSFCSKSAHPFLIKAYKTLLPLRVGSPWECKEERSLFLLSNSPSMLKCYYSNAVNLLPPGNASWCLLSNECWINLEKEKVARIKSNDVNKSCTLCEVLEHINTFTPFLKCLLFIKCLKCLISMLIAVLKGWSTAVICANDPVCSIWSCVFQPCLWL